MKNTLVIARRELAEKRFVFLTAIAFTLLAILVPFMPGVHAGERRNALAMASLIFSTGFTVGLAAILGANIIGRELADGRLSFYFARPVSSASIWFGKLIAATLLMVISFTIIVSPAFFAGIGGIVRTWTNFGDSLPAIRIVLATAAVFFLLSHVIGTFVRSRSAWLVFDFIAATICGTAIWLTGRSLLLGYAVELTRKLSWILSIFAAVAIIAAGFWQVACGRTDRKRSHIELSRFLWTALGCALLAIGGYAVWVESVSFSTLVPNSLDQTRSGRWAIINGTGRHGGDYHASFLYNLRDNRAVRIPAITHDSLSQFSAVEFSGDERTVSWVIRSMKTPAGELHLAKLGTVTPQVIATGIPSSGNFVLSDNGSRAALVRERLVTVYDLTTLTSLGSARLSDARYVRPMFVTNDLVRIYASGNETRIIEFDVVNKSLRQTGVLPAEYFRFNRDRTRALAFWKRPNAEIYDARTGALLASFNGSTSSAKFLDDGRIAAVHENTLNIFNPNGTLMRSIYLPKPIEWIASAGDGRVVVLLRNPGRRATAAVVDIERGVVVRTEEDLQPAYAGQGSVLLCSNASHDLVLWNTATGEKRVILKHS
jgi:ABC-type transport system involved in multi-copper enzyme maturation permease subunit